MEAVIAMRFVEMGPKGSDCGLYITAEVDCLLCSFSSIVFCSMDPF